MIVPVDFPKPPNVATPEAAMDVSLERLMHWDLAPENPGRLDEAGIKIALTSHGLRDAGSFLSAVRKAVKRGLKPDSALRALTVTPAELFGASQRLGTLEAGKAANFVIADGPLFEAKTKVLETWVDGRRYEIVSEPEVEMRGTWAVEVAKPGAEPEKLSIEIAGRPGKLSGKVSRGDKSSKLIAPALDDLQFTAALKGKPLGFDGILPLKRHDRTTAGGRQGCRLPSDLARRGRLGRWYPIGLHRRAHRRPQGGQRPGRGQRKGRARGKDKDEEKDDDEEAKEQQSEPTKDDDAKPAKSEEPTKAISPVIFPLGAFGRAAPPEQPTVLFRGATIWTSSEQGRLEDADLFVEGGKIKAVGKGLAAPDGARIVDAQGKHLSPGIIDCHSHIATDGGVNESAQTITAEVRIGDFVDPNDIAIYRQLAGGVTASNILHGSANTIGGQNQVLKFRWGAGPEAMKFAQAPPGIKFCARRKCETEQLGFAQHESLSPDADGRRTTRARCLRGGPAVPPPLGRVESHQGGTTAARRSGTRSPG